jgi:hypothetical protein
MLSPFALDQIEPTGDEPPCDCVVSYPHNTADTVVLVSYDRCGDVYEAVLTKYWRVTKRLTELMLSRARDERPPLKLI